MIYLITGVPGSGKTLYAVSTLVQKLAAEKITDKQGNETTRRVVVDGIPDLVFPHELMAEHNKEATTEKRGEGDGLWNWYDWCKPGDVIVVDEVQRHWRPRGMGTKPPKEIAMLETHRHLGVDFVVITQNPMLIDQNVRRLIGRHQHIRRLFGMERAVIYDWDGCSVDVHRTKSATTTYWGYPKEAFKLYKSAELHTKQKQKIPLWLAVPVLALIGGVMVAPTAFATLSGAASGKGVPSSNKVAVAPAPAAAPAPVLQGSAKPMQPLAAPVIAPVPETPIAQPAEPVLPGNVAGCVVFNDRCGCVDFEGRKVKVEQELCKVSAGINGIDKTVLDTEPVAHQMTTNDKDVFAFLHSERQRGHKKPG